MADVKSKRGLGGASQATRDRVARAGGLARGEQRRRQAKSRRGDNM